MRPVGKPLGGLPPWPLSAGPSPCGEPSEPARGRREPAWVSRCHRSPPLATPPLVRLPSLRSLPPQGSCRASPARSAVAPHPPLQRNGRLSNPQSRVCAPLSPGPRAAVVPPSAHDPARLSPRYAGTAGSGQGRRRPGRAPRQAGSAVRTAAAPALRGRAGAGSAGPQSRTAPPAPARFSGGVAAGDGGPPRSGRECFAAVAAAPERVTACIPRRSLYGRSAGPTGRTGRPRKGGGTEPDPCRWPILPIRRRRALPAFRKSGGAGGGCREMLPTDPHAWYA